MKQIPDATPELHLNGMRLTLKSLGWIAHSLETHGSVMVHGGFIDEQIPVARSLGFQVGDGDIASEIERTQMLDKQPSAGPE